MASRENEERRYVGIDLGKTGYAVAYVTGKKVKTSGGKTYPDGRVALYKQLRASDVVAMEAGGISFTMAREMKAAVGCEVVILNPGSLAVIYRSMKKTDKEDSLKLAHLVQYMPVEQLPVVPLPSEKTVERRELCAERKQTISERGRLINQLHALFLKAGITTVVKKDLVDNKAREETVKMLKGYLQLRANTLMLLLNVIEGELDRIKTAMAKDAKDDEQIKQLEEIPGVGLLTAYAFIAHVEVNRFEKASQVSNYLGLVPRVDISGTIVKYGGITKRGNGYVRSLLNQASWALVRSKNGGALKERYEYMTKVQGKSKKKSIVAVSRRLCEMMYTILCNKTKYEARKFQIPTGGLSAKRDDLAERLAAQVDEESA